MKHRLMTAVALVLLAAMALTLVSCGKEYISGTYYREIDGLKYYMEFTTEGKTKSYNDNDDPEAAVWITYYIKGDRMYMTFAGGYEQDFPYSEGSDSQGAYITFAGGKYYRMTE